MQVVFLLFKTPEIYDFLLFSLSRLSATIFLKVVFLLLLLYLSCTKQKQKLSVDLIHMGSNKVIFPSKFCFWRFILILLQVVNLTHKKCVLFATYYYYELVFAFKCTNSHSSGARLGQERERARVVAVCWRRRARENCADRPPE